MVGIMWVNLKSIKGKKSYKNITLITIYKSRGKYG